MGKSFIEAMVKGNKIHDYLFNEEAVDLEVEDAVSLADTECGIQRSGQQIDIFGRNAVQQLANVLIQEAQNNTPKSCSVIIAYSNPGNIHLLAQWLGAMMAACWQQSLTIASLTKVFYF